MATGLSIAEFTGMALPQYNLLLMNSICNSALCEGLFYFAMLRSEPAGMGWLRRLPDGAAEIARIYIRPRFRRLGLGRVLVRQLVEAARAWGYSVVKLDAGCWMLDAS